MRKSTKELEEENQKLREEVARLNGIIVGLQMKVPPPEPYFPFPSPDLPPCYPTFESPQPLTKLLPFPPRFFEPTC